jgi:hypothetical protein
VKYVIFSITPFPSKFFLIMGDVCHGLFCHPLPSGIRSGKMHLLATSWATPGTLSFYFALGDEVCYFFITAFQSKTLPIMGDVHRGLFLCRWPFGLRSSIMHLLATLWATPGMLGLLYFALWVELYFFVYQCILKQNFA